MQFLLTQQSDLNGGRGMILSYLYLYDCPSYKRCWDLKILHDQMTKQSEWSARLYLLYSFGQLQDFSNWLYT